MRKVYFEIKATLIVTVDDDTNMDEVMENLHIDSVDPTVVQIEDSEIVDYNVTDSK